MKIPPRLLRFAQRQLGAWRELLDFIPSAPPHFVVEVDYGSAGMDRAQLVLGYRRSWIVSIQQWSHWHPMKDTLLVECDRGRCRLMPIDKKDLPPLARVVGS